jgi:hypothetical protein
LFALVAELVVPLKNLMENNPVNESADSNAKHKTGQRYNTAFYEGGSGFPWTSGVVSGSSGSLRRPMAAIAIGYMVSRGLAKPGSADRRDND